jgi:hypothetical protein
MENNRMKIMEDPHWRQNVKTAWFIAEVKNAINMYIRYNVETGICEEAKSCTEGTINMIKTLNDSNIRVYKYKHK